MLVRLGSRSSECRTQHPLAMLSAGLFSRWKLGEGSVQLEYTGCRWQTSFAFGCPLNVSRAAHFRDCPSAKIDEIVISSFRMKVSYLLSLFLDFWSVITRCSGLQTNATTRPAALDDCFVQAHVLKYTQRGGPLNIGGRDTRRPDDGHANYLNMIQALTSLKVVKQDECIDFAGQASACWAFQGACTGPGRRASADREAKKNMRYTSCEGPRPFYDLLEPVESFT